MRTLDSLRRCGKWGRAEKKVTGAWVHQRKTVYLSPKRTDNSNNHELSTARKKLTARTEIIERRCEETTRKIDTNHWQTNRAFRGNQREQTRLRWFGVHTWVIPPTLEKNFDREQSLLNDWNITGNLGKSGGQTCLLFSVARYPLEFWRRPELALRNSRSEAARESADDWCKRLSTQACLRPHRCLKSHEFSNKI